MFARYIQRTEIKEFPSISELFFYYNEMKKNTLKTTANRASNKMTITLCFLDDKQCTCNL